MSVIVIVSIIGVLLILCAVLFLGVRWYRQTANNCRDSVRNNPGGLGQTKFNSDETQRASQKIEPLVKTDDSQQHPGVLDQTEFNSDETQRASQKIEPLVKTDDSQQHPGVLDQTEFNSDETQRASQKIKTLVKTDSQRAVDHHEPPSLNNPDSESTSCQTRVLKIDFCKLSTIEQAQAILEYVAQLHSSYPNALIGITYSANDEQYRKIWETYSAGMYNTGTSGANQAAVIYHVENSIVSNSDLAKVFRIIPIPTMTKCGPRQTTDELVSEALDRATEFVQSGNILIGWANQCTTVGRLAIGGGVAAGVQPATQIAMIDAWVSRTFSWPSPIVSSGLTQA